MTEKMVRVEIKQPMSNGGLRSLLQQAVLGAGDGHMVDVLGVESTPAGVAIPTDWPTWLAVWTQTNDQGELVVRHSGPFWTRDAAEDWSRGVDDMAAFSYVQTEAPDQQARLR
jgi:hypothetical protein